MASSALGRNRSHTRPTAILRCGDPERCGDRGFKGSLLFWFKQGRNLVWSTLLSRQIFWQKIWFQGVQHAA